MAHKRLHTSDPKQDVRGRRVHGELHSAAAGLSDADLLAQVAILARAEREATVELLAHLAELDSRKLYLGQGPSAPSRRVRGLQRIEVARASREIPAILDLLVAGSLNLATARLLAPHLRRENFEALAAMAKGKSKREVEVLVAALAPQRDIACSVRKLPARVPPFAQAAAALHPRSKSSRERPLRSSRLRLPLCPDTDPAVPSSLQFPSERRGIPRPVGLRVSSDPRTARPWPRSLRRAIECSSPLAKRRTTSCVEPRTCSAARSPARRASGGAATRASEGAATGAQPQDIGELPRH